MQVQMKTTRRESPDDITSYVYQQGIRYDVPEQLGRRMLEQDWADEVDPNTGQLIAASRPADGAAPKSTERKAVNRNRDHN
jgi:hypothetical protein